jgi:hypothetical protein
MIMYCGKNCETLDSGTFFMVPFSCYAVESGSWSQVLTCEIRFLQETCDITWSNMFRGHSRFNTA